MADAYRASVPFLFGFQLARVVPACPPAGSGGAYRHYPDVAERLGVGAYRPTRGGCLTHTKVRSGVGAGNGSTLRGNGT